MEILNIKPNVNHNFKAIVRDEVPVGKHKIRKDLSIYRGKPGNCSYRICTDDREESVCWDGKYLIWDDSIPPFTEGFMPVVLTKQEFNNLFTVWE